MVAVLTENFGGKWPFWLSPRQAMVVPVGPHVNSYAQEIRDRLQADGYCTDVDVDDGNTMNKKVRNAQLAQYNFILGRFVPYIISFAAKNFFAFIPNLLFSIGSIFKFLHKFYNFFTNTDYKKMTHQQA